jgi:hypothetical protein
MNDRIKQNNDYCDNLKRHRKEYGIEPWRATGRTSRTLLDMASRYPEGDFVLICHSSAMARLCFEKFVEIQAVSGAPLKINKPQMEIKLQGARYLFKVESQHLHQSLHPDVEIFLDHHVQEVENTRRARRMREAKLMQELREQGYIK